jgi:hypothetical protein
MEANGVYLTIESIKKTSPQSFSNYLAKELYDWVEKEHKGDFSAIEMDGSDYILYLIGQYEDGARVKS